MKFLRQFIIILVISFIGELLKYILPLPVPASIYGMVILFVGLLTGLIKLENVREAGRFLIEIMPIMFIPAGVWSDGILGSFIAYFGTGGSDYHSGTYNCYGSNGTTGTDDYSV